MPKQRPVPTWLPTSEAVPLAAYLLIAGAILALAMTILLTVMQ